MLTKRPSFSRVYVFVGLSVPRLIKVYHPGIYQFSWSALSPDYSPLRLSLMRNGVEEVSSWADSEGFQTAAGSALLDLDTGDQVSMEVRQGRIHETNDWDHSFTSFSGIKIY